MDKKLFLKVISQFIKQGLPQGFTGLGIILIDNDIGDLPISSLLSEDEHYGDLSDKEIINFIFEISNLIDNRHDGFHVISKKYGLLKISQYFAPAIPIDFNDTVFNVGARYRTAQYGSLYEKVSSIIIISQKGELSLAQNGIVELIVI